MAGSPGIMAMIRKTMTVMPNSTGSAESSLLTMYSPMVQATQINQTASTVANKPRAVKEIRKKGGSPAVGKPPLVRQDEASRG